MTDKEITMEELEKELNKRILPKPKFKIVTRKPRPDFYDKYIKPMTMNPPPLSEAGDDFFKEALDNLMKPPKPFTFEEIANCINGYKLRDWKILPLSEIPYTVTGYKCDTIIYDLIPSTSIIRRTYEKLLNWAKRVISTTFRKKKSRISFKD